MIPMPPVKMPEKKKTFSLLSILYLGSNLGMLHVCQQKIINNHCTRLHEQLLISGISICLLVALLSPWECQALRKSLLSTRPGHLMFSALGSGSSPDQDHYVVSWARHFTLIVPLSNPGVKWVPANLMLGVTLQINWTSIPSRGSMLLARIKKVGVQNFYKA